MNNVLNDLSGPEVREDEVDINNGIDGVSARSDERRVAEGVDPEEAVEPHWENGADRDPDRSGVLIDDGGNTLEDFLCEGDSVSPDEDDEQVDQTDDQEDDGDSGQAQAEVHDGSTNVKS